MIDDQHLPQRAVLLDLARFALVFSLPYGKEHRGSGPAVTKRRRGHFCWSCGRSLPNERFSGGGHVRHVCRECSRLGAEELEYRQTVRDIERVLRSSYSISRRERASLERYLQHPNLRVQLYAAKLLFEGERQRAESRIAWEENELPGALRLAYEEYAIESCRCGTG